MKIHIIGYLIFSLTLLSCGEDTLNSSSKNLNQYSVYEGKECSCTSEEYPVCADDVSFQNECMASCYNKSKYAIGRCEKDRNPNRYICLSDNTTIDEVSAFVKLKNHPDLSIKQYVACGSVTY